MRKSFVTLAASAALVAGLTGCHTVRVGPDEIIKAGDRTIVIAGVNGFDSVAVTRPNPRRPNVFITEREQIVADQEPIRPVDDGTHLIALAWALDKDSDYVFPDDSAIVFQNVTGSSPPRYECRVSQPKRKVITCWYYKPEAPAKWKYAIKVNNQRTSRPLVSLDPWVYQD